VPNLRLIWLKRGPHDMFRAPRHLKDFQRSWFDELLWAMFESDTQGYLAVCPDLWLLAGAHNAAYFDKHKAAVLACFESAQVGNSEVISYVPLLHTIHNLSTEIHQTRPKDIHRANSGACALESSGSAAVADRGGGSPSLSASASESVSTSTQFGESTARARVKTYTQTDFDERDLRKLAQAERELATLFEQQPWLGEEEMFEMVCRRAGITLQRGRALLARQGG
jgi:hypothetical protein